MLLQGYVGHKYWTDTDYSLVLYIWPKGSLALNDGIVVKIFDGMTLAEMYAWITTFLRKHPNISIEQWALNKLLKEVSIHA
jgi:hypothetical protein